MQMGPRLAAVLTAATVAGALLTTPVAAQQGTGTATTVVAPTQPPIPALATTAPLPTQSTSLTPVTAPPTTADAINDAEATRLVNRIVIALAGLALLIALVTLWYWRATRPVPPSLEGLELISTRKWLRGKPDKRARLLGEYHVKRGPVPAEVIARSGAPTVRVGAAVAAPAMAMAGGGLDAGSPSTGPHSPTPAAAPAASSSLQGLTDDPVLVSEADDLDAEVGADAGSTASPELAEPGQATGPTTPESGTPVANGTKSDGADSVFTVVARRPRTDGEGPAAPA